MNSYGVVLVQVESLMCLFFVYDCCEWRRIFIANTNSMNIEFRWSVEGDITCFCCFLKSYLKKTKNEALSSIPWVFFVYMNNIFGNEYVYIRGTSYLERIFRNMEILRLYNLGVSTKNIAATCNVGERQVRNIINEGYRYDAVDVSDMFEDRVIMLNLR